MQFVCLSHSGQIWISVQKSYFWQISILGTTQLKIWKNKASFLIAILIVVITTLILFWILTCYCLNWDLSWIMLKRKIPKPATVVCLAWKYYYRSNPFCTDYEHTMARSIILYGPNSNTNPSPHLKWIFIWDLDVKA